jgi:hypothetical protein
VPMNFSRSQVAPATTDNSDCGATTYCVGTRRGPRLVREESDLRWPKWLMIACGRRTRLRHEREVLSAAFPLWSNASFGQLWFILLGWQADDFLKVWFPVLTGLELALQPFDENDEQRVVL